MRGRKWLAPPQQLHNRVQVGSCLWWKTPLFNILIAGDHLKHAPARSKSPRSPVLTARTGKDCVLASDVMTQEAAR